MKWKIYFWVYTIISAFGLIILIPLLSKPNFENAEGTIENIILILGTLSYVYNKNIFKPVVWKTIFVLISIIWFLQIFASITTFEYLNFMHSDYSLEAIIFSMIISLPALIAIYRLGKANFLKIK